MMKNSILSIPLMCMAFGLGAAAAKDKETSGMSKSGGMTMMDMTGGIKGEEHEKHHPN
jgi:hypothetical protein